MEGEKSGFNSRQRQGILSSTERPDRLWGPSSLLYNGYRGQFPRGVKRQGVNLTTHLHLVLRLRVVEPYLHSPICLHDVMLNSLSTEATLPLLLYRAVWTFVGSACIEKVYPELQFPPCFCYTFTGNYNYYGSVSRVWVFFSAPWSQMRSVFSPNDLVSHIRQYVKLLFCKF
jgi:hypothetical protein